MNGRYTGIALAGILLISTLDEGSAAPTGLLIVHGAVALLVVASLAWPPSGREQQYRAARGPSLALAVFPGLVWLGALLAPYRYSAFLTTLEIVYFVAVFHLAGWAGPDLPKRLAGPLLVAGGTQGLLALIQRASGAPRPAGTFLNPNHLAGWLFAVFLLALSATPDVRTTTWRAARWGILAIAFLAAAMTASRGAALGVLAGGVLLIVRVWPRMSTRARRVAITGAVAAVVVIGGWLVWRFLSEDPYRYYRWRIWRSSLTAVLEAPWTGTGPGQFENAAANLNFPSEEGPLRFSRGFKSTHSDLVRLPCEFGWPATVAALTAVAIAGMALRRRRRHDQNELGIAGATAALLALGIQAATADNLSERPALFLLAAVLAGSLMSEPRPRPGRRHAGLAAAAVILVATAFALGDVATYASWRAVRGLPRGRLTDDARARLESATKRNPLQPDLWMRLAQDLMGDDREWDARAYARSREFAEHAIRLDPASAATHRTLARVEALGCLMLFRDEASRARAAAAYAAAEERSRRDPYLCLEKSRFLLDAGDRPGARRAVDRALAIEPRALAPRLLLAEILAGGDLDEKASAVRVLDEAQTIAASWAGWTPDSPYARNLMTLDRAKLAMLRARLEGRRGQILPGGPGIADSGGPLR
jgi:O-antigen ligase